METTEKTAMGNEKRRSLVQVVIVAVFFIAKPDASSSQWTPMDEKKADIGIVIDHHPLEHPTFPQELNQGNGSETLTEVFKRSLRELLESSEASQIDVKIAVMFHDKSKIHLAMSLEESTGKKVDEIMAMLSGSLRFEVTLYRQRLQEDDQIVAEARRLLAESAKNRPHVPEFLLWIALYDEGKQSDQFGASKLLLNRSNGPDMVWTTKEARLPVVHTRGVSTCGRPAIIFDVTSLLLNCLNSCKSEVQTSSCYFAAAGGSCQKDVSYRSLGGNPQDKLRYCVNGTATFSCNDSSECESVCNNHQPREIFRPCSVTCGDGVMFTRPANAEQDKYLQYCPEKQEPCSAEPCPATTQPLVPPTTTTTTTPRPKTTTTTKRIRTVKTILPIGPTAAIETSEIITPTAVAAPDATKPESTDFETWKIVLIVLGALFLIILIIVLIICLSVRKRKERRPGWKHGYEPPRHRRVSPPRHWDHQHTRSPSHRSLRSPSASTGRRSRSPHYLEPRGPHYWDPKSPRPGSPSGMGRSHGTATGRHKQQGESPHRKAAYSPRALRAKSGSKIPKSPASGTLKTASTASAFTSPSTPKRSTSTITSRSPRTPRTPPSSLPTTSHVSSQRPTASRSTYSKQKR